MFAWLAYLIIAGSLALMVWCIVAVVQGARPSKGQLICAVVLLVALLTQVVAGIVAMVQRTDPLDRVTFVGYLLTTVLVLVAGVFWGIADRSRWGNGVFALACATEAVLVVRLLSIWSVGV